MHQPSAFCPTPFCTARNLVAMTLLIFFFLICPSANAQSKTAVHLNVAYSKSLPIGVAQEWLTRLKDAGADRIRLMADPDQEPSIKETSKSPGRTITVNARIDSRQNLVVPNRSFSIREVASIKSWFNDLRASKPSEVTDSSQEPMGAFGLSPEKLVTVYESLGNTFPASTRDMEVSEVVKKVRQQIGLSIGASSVAIDRIAESTKVPDELEGLSCGTVLAAAIRPLGLVFEINSAGNRITIVETRNAKKHWPVGWPPQKRPGLVAPSLFKHNDFDIEGFPLSAVLPAIEAKTQVPFIIDQNSLARAGIELEKVEINITPRKTFYEQLIRQVLAQARPPLTAELRVDEAGQPFLWVTLSKPLR